MKHHHNQKKSSISCWSGLSFKGGINILFPKFMPNYYLKDYFKPLGNFLLTKLDLAFLFAFRVRACQRLWLTNNLLWSLDSSEILPLLSCIPGWLLLFFSCSIWFCRSSVIWSFFLVSFLHLFLKLIFAGVDMMNAFELLTLFLQFQYSCFCFHS